MSEPRKDLTGLLAAYRQGDRDAFDRLLPLVYRDLQRLAKRGWLASEWRQTDANQRAKFYRLTPEGKKQLLREQTRWGELVAAIGRILNPATAPSGSKG